MYQKFLQKLGLSSDESEVYMYLIESPKKNISEISQALHIHRPKLYDILPNMITMGIISEVMHGKRTLYMAQDPKMLQNLFDSIQSDYQALIPELGNIYAGADTKPVFKHYRGEKGIQHIFIDIAHTLKKGDIFYRYSSRNNVKKTSIPQSDYNVYKKIRDEKQLERMVITNDYLNSLKTNNLDKEVVVIPKEYDLFEDNITKIIYGHKVAIIDYNSLESFVIESQVFAYFEEKLFKLLFQFLRK